MKIKFEIYNECFDRKEFFEQRLTFVSNIGMKEYAIQEIVPKNADKNYRSRTLDKMFYELRRAVDQDETSFDNLLSAMKTQSEVSHD